MPFSRNVFGLLALATLAACGACETTQPATKGIDYTFDAAPNDTLFVHTDDLVALTAEGAALFDARGSMDFLADHIPGAVHTPWDQFTDGFLSGVLDDDLDGIQTSLRALGVRGDRPVVVYGNWDQGWGEEGRVHWTLTYLGHKDVRVLYGGMPRWLAESRDTESFSDDPAEGDFEIALRPEMRTSAETILEWVEGGGSGGIVLDTRTLEEFEGATPYAESRGGHVPGAKHYFWRRVFAKDGNLRPRAELRAEFEALGLSSEAAVVSYCTGGVRSGFMVMILGWLGFEKASNYDGSWWDWSGRESYPVSLDPAGR